MSSYPGTIDSFSVVAGTTSVSAADHAGIHNKEGSAVVNIENTLGTTAGTSVLKNFTAGNFSEREGTLTFGSNRYSLGVSALSQGQYLNYNGTNVVGSSVAASGSAGTLVFGLNNYVLGTGALSQGSFLNYNGTNIVGSAAEVPSRLTFGTNVYSLGTASLSQGSALFYNGTNVVGSAVTSFVSPLTTKGDLYTYSTADIRLAVGANDRLLTGDSSQATGLRWTNNITTFEFGTVNTNVLGAPAQSSSIQLTNAVLPKSFILTDTVGTITTTFGGTASPQLIDLILGTAAGNRTIGTPSNTTSNGYALTYRIKQNSGNTGTIVWDSVYRFPAEVGTPVLGGASTWTNFNFLYGTTDAKFDYQYQSGYGTNIVTLTGTQTLTNKTIDGGNNTLQNIPTSALVGSAITQTTSVLGVAGGQSIGTTIADVTSATVTMTTTGGICVVMANIGGRMDTSDTHWYATLNLDGSDVSGVSELISSSTANARAWRPFFYISTPSAASHTWKLRAKANTNTMVTEGASIIVVELKR